MRKNAETSWSFECFCVGTGSCRPARQLIRLVFRKALLSIAVYLFFDIVGAVILGGNSFEIQVFENRAAGFAPRSCDSLMQSDKFAPVT